jgi:response regulator RpfG family c-di-GMP phosphodiesterase
MDTELIATTPSRATRRRDQKTRYHLRVLLERAPHLNDPRFAPLVRNFLHVSFILERAYQRLANADLISPVTGELRSSVDVLRRLSETHRMLARELKLSPSVVRHGLMDLAGAIADAGKVEIP